MSKSKCLIHAATSLANVFSQQELNDLAAQIARFRKDLGLDAGLKKAVKLAKEDILAKKRNLELDGRVIKKYLEPLQEGKIGLGRLLGNVPVRFSKGPLAIDEDFKKLINLSKGDNVDNAQRAAETELANIFHNHISSIPPKDLSYIKSAAAMDELGKYMDSGEYTNDHIKTYGDALIKLRDETEKRKVKAGVILPSHVSDDFYLGQLYDAKKLHGTMSYRGKFLGRKGKPISKDGFIAKMYNVCNIPRMFPLTPGTASEKFVGAMSDIYDSIIRGDSAYTEISLSEEDLLKRSRQFIRFKDWSSYFKAMKHFGRFDTPQDLATNFIKKSARQLGFSQILGPDYNYVYRHFRKNLSDKDLLRLTGVKQFFNPANLSVQQLHDVVTGASSVPLYEGLAKTGATFRALTSGYKIINMLMASIPDTGYGATHLAMVTGEPYLKSLANSFSNLYIKDKKLTREVSKSLFFFTMHFTNQLARTMQDEFVRSGTQAFVNKGFDFAIGSVDRAKIMSAAVSLLRTIGTYDDRFSTLSPQLRKNFNDWGVNDKDYSLLRKYDIIDDSGDRHFNPLAPSSMSKDELKSLSLEGDDETATAARLNRSLFGMMEDISRSTVAYSDAFSTAMATRGTRPGTVHGEMYRLFFQFKGFYLSHLFKNIVGAFQSSGNAKDKIRFFSLMVGSQVFFGTVASMLYDMWNGKAPSPIPTKTSSIIDTFTGLGMIGQWTSTDNFLFSSPSLKVLTSLAQAGFDVSQLPTKKGRKEREKQLIDIRNNIYNTTVGSVLTANLPGEYYIHKNKKKEY